MISSASAPAPRRRARRRPAAPRASSVLTSHRWLVDGAGRVGARRGVARRGRRGRSGLRSDGCRLPHAGDAAAVAATPAQDTEEIVSARSIAVFGAHGATCRGLSDEPDDRAVSAAGSRPSSRLKKKRTRMRGRSGLRLSTKSGRRSSERARGSGRLTRRCANGRSGQQPVREPAIAVSAPRRRDQRAGRPPRRRRRPLRAPLRDMRLAEGLDRFRLVCPAAWRPRHRSKQPGPRGSALQPPHARHARKRRGLLPGLVRRSRSHARERYRPRPVQTATSTAAQPLQEAHGCHPCASGETQRSVRRNALNLSAAPSGRRRPDSDERRMLAPALHGHRRSPPQFATARPANETRSIPGQPGPTTWRASRSD